MAFHTDILNRKGDRETDQAEEQMDTDQKKNRNRFYFYVSFLFILSPQEMNRNNLCADCKKKGGINSKNPRLEKLACTTIK